VVKLSCCFDTHLTNNSLVALIYILTIYIYIYIYVCIRINPKNPIKTQWPKPSHGEQNGRPKNMQPARTKEGRKLVPLVDSNIPNRLQKLITYPIPVNDDSIQFVYLFCNLITKTVILSQSA
jgi:hypothetical protein